MTNGSTENRAPSLILGEAVFVANEVPITTYNLINNLPLRCLCAFQLHFFARRLKK